MALPENIEIVSSGFYQGDDSDPENYNITGYEARAYRWTGDVEGQSVFYRPGVRRNLIQVLMEHGYVEVPGHPNFYKLAGN